MQPSRLSPSRANDNLLHTGRAAFAPSTPTERPYGSQYVWHIDRRNQIDLEAAHHRSCSRVPQEPGGAPRSSHHRRLAGVALQGRAGKQRTLPRPQRRLHAPGAHGIRRALSTAPWASVAGLIAYDKSSDAVARPRSVAPSSTVCPVATNTAFLAVTRCHPCTATST